MFIRLRFQVYPCNRRGIQPTFGCSVRYVNVLPVLYCVHFCNGNCKIRIIYNSLLKFISNTFLRLQRKLCRVFR
jgi:hypothetical protein